MNELPRTLTNPSIRDKVTFIKTAADTGGEYIEVEVELAPGGGNALHYHVDYSEFFEVLDGTLGIQYKKKKMYLREGEIANVAVHINHRFFNPSKDATVKFRTIVKPARQFEEMIRIAYGLANDGLTNKNGVPNIWYLAIMVEKGGSYYPGVPYKLQKIFYRFLANLAKRKGMDKHLNKYYTA